MKRLNRWVRGEAPRLENIQEVYWESWITTGVSKANRTYHDRYDGKSAHVDAQGQVYLYLSAEAYKAFKRDRQYGQVSHLYSGRPVLKCDIDYVLIVDERGHFVNKIYNSAC